MSGVADDPAAHSAENDLAGTTPARRQDQSGLFALAIRGGMALLLPAKRPDAAEQNQRVAPAVRHHDSRGGSRTCHESRWNKAALVVAV
jgi:hypothetical protein